MFNSNTKVNTGIQNSLTDTSLVPAFGLSDLCPNPDFLSLSETYHKITLSRGLALDLSQAKPFEENMASSDDSTCTDIFLSDICLDFSEMASFSPHPSIIEEAREIYTDENYIIQDGGQMLRKSWRPFKILRQSKKIIKEDHHQSSETESTSKRRKGCNVFSRKHLWTEEQDSQLRDLVEEFGPKWSRIGCIMQKTGKQARDRYLNNANTNINKGEWTEEEDSLFLSLFKKFGKKWCQIASEMPGRTENQVKNKFSCLVRDVKNKEEQSVRHINLKNAIENFINRVPDSEKSDLSVVHQRPAGIEDIDKYFDFEQTAQRKDEFLLDI